MSEEKGLFNKVFSKIVKKEEKETYSYNPEDFEFMLLEGEDSGTKIPLSKNLTTIGRKLPSDKRQGFILINDKTSTMSSKQADIEWDGNRKIHILIPKNTANPTKVNTKEISKPYNLSPGDIIEMGKVIIRYQQAPKSVLITKEAPLFDDTDTFFSSNSEENFLDNIPLPPEEDNDFTIFEETSPSLLYTCYKFSVEEGPDRGKVFSISKDSMNSILTIGYEGYGKSDIYLKDSSIGHYQISLKQDRDSLKISSNTKLLINSLPLQEKILKENDLIKFGNSLLKFNISDGDSEKYELEIIEGPFKGNTYHLNKDKIIIGRKSIKDTMTFKDIELPSADRSVSRKHGRLVKKGDTFYLINDTQKSSTLVNDKPFQESVPLKNGDRIKIGELTVLLFKKIKPDEDTEDKDFTIAPEKIKPSPPEDMAFIKGGSFLMGSDDDPGGDTYPLHNLTVKDFYIDIYPVTNKKYKDFIDNTDYKSEGPWTEFYSPDKEDHPVVNVTWNDALAYSSWAKKRLPTEAEWEYTAKGPNNFKYPWGNEWNKNKLNSKESDLNSTTPVDKYPDGKNIYGVTDIMGNVWEWTSSTYGPYPYKEGFLKKTSGKTIRGGSWINILNLAGSTVRCEAFPREFGPDLGFRCVKDIQEYLL